MIEEFRGLLSKCSEDQRCQIFEELRKTMPPHPFELRMKASADVILEALDRASPLSLRGIRGLIAEATFVLEVIPSLAGWQALPLVGDFPYDAELKDFVSTITVQVKMQRQEKGVPLIRQGTAVVEVQRTRGGKRDGKDTRPYHFGEFDILAVCMEPSHSRWNSFLYIPTRWLKPRVKNPDLIHILQSVSLKSDEIWTDNFDEAIRRLRSELPRPNSA
ncbi:MAG: hypothetical protein WCD79_17130 [Chthoniobacteraceae bacterium]